MNQDKAFFDIPFEEFLKLNSHANLTACVGTNLSGANSCEEMPAQVITATQPEMQTFQCISLSEIRLEQPTDNSNLDPCKPFQTAPTDSNAELEALLAALNESGNGLLVDHKRIDCDPSDVTLHDDGPQIDLVHDEPLAAAEKHRLHTEITAAQKKLADYERRIVELRRVHRQTFKKALRAEEHMRRLIERERQRNDAARKRSDEQQEVLNGLRSLSTQAEEKLEALLEETRIEQARIDELERDIAVKRAALDYANQSQKELENEDERVNVAHSFINAQSHQTSNAHASKSKTEHNAGDLGCTMPPLQSTNDYSATIKHETQTSLVEKNGSARPTTTSANETERSAALIEGAGKPNDEEFFTLVGEAFEDQSLHVRKVALQLLLDRQQDRVATLTRILRESLPERRQKIGRTMIESGVSDEFLQNLAGSDSTKVDEANSILFLLCKTGEIQPLVTAIEQHPSDFVKLTAVKLIATSENRDVISILRKFAVRTSMPVEVRSVAMSALNNKMTSA